MSDETDLNILNNSMEVMVNQYHKELLPVAAQLTAHLCESYMRCIRDVAQQDVNVNPNNIEFEDVVDIDDDKTFAAMGIAKTISTVVDSIDTSNEILAQVQEIIIPILVFTLETKLIGEPTPLCSG